MRVQNYELKGSGYFNGTNAVVSFTAVQASLSTFLNGTSGLTWSGWIKPSVDTGSNQVVFSLLNATGVCLNAFIYTGTGAIGTQSRSNAEALVTSTTATRVINYGTWYHLTVVADFANNRQVTYLNGVKIRTDSFSYAQTTLAMASGNGGIGASPTASWYRGYISSARLIKGAVTDEEAYALYLNNTPPANKPTAILCDLSKSYLSTLPDGSGNGHTGANANTVFSQETPLAPRVEAQSPRVSARFSSNRINTTNNIAVTDFSFSTWLQMGNVAAGTYTLLSGLLSDTPKIQIDSSDRLTLTRLGTGVTATTTAIINRQGAWQHIGVTYNNTTGMASFFINGVKFYEASASGTYSVSTQVRIGADESAANALTGRIRDTAYWSRTLSEDEMLQVYKSSPRGMFTNQEFYYSFNRSITALDVLDESLSNNPGLQTSAPTYDLVNPSNARRIMSSDLGASGRFNGSNSVVSVPSATVSSRLQGASGVTLSAWARPQLNGVQQNIIFIANSGGATGASLIILSTNNLNGTWRSRAGGAAGGASAAIRHMTTNSWQHFTVSANYVTKETFAYVNGELFSRSTIAFEDDTYQCGDGALTLGSAVSPLLGQMNDPRVYKTQLSHGEVRELFLGGEPQRANLVYQGKFEGGGGTTVYDVSGYGSAANGTATNLTLSNDVPY